MFKFWRTKNSLPDTAGAKLYRSKLLLRSLTIVVAVTVCFGALFYAAFELVEDNNMATITVGEGGSGGTKDVQISLSETPEFESGTVALHCEGIKGMTNISGYSIPTDVEDTNGSHNGEHYIAYTFYVKNTGKIPCVLKEKMTIDGSVKKAEDAVRIRIYRDGEAKTYAKLGSDGMPEYGTTAFVSSTVFNETVGNFAPGQIIKYTMVIWLEGDDPECLDNIKGGAVKLSMTFESEASPGGSET